MNLKKLITFYFINSYHRPSAKIQSLITFFHKFIYSKKTDIFSERSALLKKPPIPLEFYNFFGRLLLYLKYSFFILLFNNYPSSSLIKIYDNEYSRSKKRLINPILPFDLLDSNNDDLDYKKILFNYYEHLKAYRNINGDSKWWIKCRDEFQNLFITPDKKLNINSLKNFRSSYSPSAALLNDSSRLLNKKRPSKIIKLMSLRLIMLYHELAERINRNILLVNSESKVGNPPMLIYRDTHLSQRNLRYSYYLSSLEENLSNLFDMGNKIILDIGGGYGGLIRAMYHYFPKNTYMICELPETLLLADYFLRSCFSEKSFLHIHDIDFLNNQDKETILKYDFILFTPDVFYNLKKKIIDLSINTTSLCEMTSASQQKYINNIEITSNYFYSVNRYSARKDKYDANGIEDLSFSKQWKPLKVAFTHTYHLEFLGKNQGV